MTKNQTLRAALNSGKLFTAMAAHNPIAAKLAARIVDFIVMSPPVMPCPMPTSCPWAPIWR